MTDVVSVINLKGGVGKTTLTVALAETFAAEFRKGVLVIDLDPQTNATVMLIGESKWSDLNKEGRTLAHVFERALAGSIDEGSLRSIVVEGASDVTLPYPGRIDLVPSSLDLITVEERLHLVPAGPFGAVRPFDVLWRGGKNVIGDYELVLIDCPPSLGTITLNGLRLSRWVLIPTIPDILSTYGIPQIVSRVRRFAEEADVVLSPLGIVATRYRTGLSLHHATVTELRAKHALDPRNWPRVFRTVIPDGVAIAKAAERTVSKRTLKQKWDRHAAEFIALAREIAAELER